jgi:hypothetical protein
VGGESRRGKGDETETRRIYRTRENDKITRDLKGADSFLRHKLVPVSNTMRMYWGVEVLLHRS